MRRAAVLGREVTERFVPRLRTKISLLARPSHNPRRLAATRRKSTLARGFMHERRHALGAVYFTTWSFVRSIVAAAASTIRIPKTICWAKMSTPMNVMPILTTEMISAPISV